eukprot:2561499-Rhodomonas_salina.2
MSGTAYAISGTDTELALALTADIQYCQCICHSVSSTDSVPAKICPGPTACSLSHIRDSQCVCYQLSGSDVGHCARRWCPGGSRSRISPR